MLACLCCRVERRERARLKNVKFSGKGSDPKVRYTFTSGILSVSSLYQSSLTVSACLQTMTRVVNDDTCGKR